MRKHKCMTCTHYEYKNDDHYCNHIFAYVIPEKEDNCYNYEGIEKEEE